MSRTSGFKHSEKTKQKMRVTARENAALTSQSTRTRHSEPTYQEKWLAAVRTPANRQRNSEQKRVRDLSMSFAQRQEATAKARVARRLQLNGMSKNERRACFAVAHVKYQEKRDSIIHKIKETRFREWANPEMRARRLAAMAETAAKFYRGHLSSLETAVRDVLDLFHVTYISQKPFGPYILDFYLPQWKVDLEADGEWAHQGREEHDQTRNNWMNSHGLQVFRLKEKDIKADAVRCVKEVIKEIKKNENPYTSKWRS